jgi:hypothetical protein
VQEDGRFTPLADIPLDVDEDGLRRRRGSGEEVIDDRDINVFRNQNRIALAKGVTTKLPPGAEGDPGQEYYDLPLICVVHAAPGCRFQWARLTVDLSPTVGARIRDMAPRDVQSDEPVEITTTVSAGLQFANVVSVLGASVGNERTTSRKVYYPKILSSGPGFARGYWDFHSTGDAYLHSNRELRLLIGAPPGADLVARFRLKAEVAVAGLARVVPLLSRRGGEIDELCRLT